MQNFRCSLSKSVGTVTLKLLGNSIKIGEKNIGDNEQNAKGLIYRKSLLHSHCCILRLQIEND